MAAKNFPVELQILPSEIIHDYSTHAVKVINARLIIPCLRDVPLQMWALDLVLYSSMGHCHLI